VVLITGDGSTLKDDIAKFLAMRLDHDVYGIARSYQAYPSGMRLDHWADVDGEQSIWWAEHLPPDKIQPHTMRHTLGDVRGFDVDWNVDGSPYDMSEVWWHGSTALFAVLTSLAMGYDRAILAGCPLDENGHWYFPDSTGPFWNEQDYIAWKKFALSDEAERVKSFSGFTREILGAPGG